MDIYTLVAMLLIFFVASVTVFTWVRSKKTIVRGLGYVAETCTKCKAACCVKVNREEVQTRILYVPLGRARLFGYWGQCQQCSGELELQPTDYAALEKDAKIPLESLIVSTNPKLNSDNNAAMAAFERFARVREPLLRSSQSLQERYAEGKGIDFPTAVAFLVAFTATASVYSIDEATLFFYVAVAAIVPLLWCGQTLSDRHGGGRQLDIASGLAFAAAFMVPIGLLVLAPGLPRWVDGALLIVGLLAASAVLFGESRRFFQRELRGVLATALKRVDPQPAELESCLVALGQYEHRICKFVTTQSLLQDLSETPVPPPIEAVAASATSATAAASVAPATIDAGPRGVCPNCASEIALNSSECPNLHCKALFGPHSAWKIKPA